MNSNPARQHRTSRRPRAGLATLVAVLGVAVAAPAASSAETLTESLYGPSMKLEFAGHTARLAGSGAVVLVRCTGPRSGTCVGTASLRVRGAERSVAFSIPGGMRRHLVVPLGSDRGRLGKKRVRAFAETVQPLGSCRESRRALRVR